MASSYAALSALLRVGGRRAEALTYAQVALEAKQRAYGPQHAEVAAAMLHLADILRDLGRYSLPLCMLRLHSEYLRGGSILGMPFYYRTSCSGRFSSLLLGC